MRRLLKKIQQMISGLLTAYIGPGAGFAFLGSFMILFVALLLVFAALLSWPFRAVWSVLRRRNKKLGKAKAKRLVIVGLDGLDYGRSKRLIEQGRLPNFKALQDEGSFEPLWSTCPPLSPVAWSSFMTGVNPGKHNIFDFLNRSLRTCLPELSSSRVEAGNRGKPVVRLLRKSKPFWSILGEYGIFSTVLRVPITFPPEPFYGVSLSGMCVPDLRGTQGTFTCITDRPDNEKLQAGGEIQTVAFEKDRAETFLAGPAMKDKPLKVPVKLRRFPGKKQVQYCVGSKRGVLEEGRYTDWIRVEFRIGLFKKVSGICRFYLSSFDDPFSLYVTPINIDPAKPALPVSHPAAYAVYLAKLHGAFATLGLAEDTWALNEGIIDDETFLEQVYDIHDERERMFFDALKRTRKGACICVFDTSDRIQHMFMRQSENVGETEEAASASVIEQMYEKMDELVGRVRSTLKKDDVMMVLSDHGFTHFKVGMHVNAWLKKEGYLVEKEDADTDEYFQSIDWEKTRAYCFGLSGVYINLKGREKQGCVAREELPKLKQEIIAGLESVVDPQSGTHAVKKAYDADEVYSGPYRNNGPDIVLGFEDGYRVSWECAVGRVGDELFSANDKAWSGDHCVDRSVVPGVFFCNRKVPVKDQITLTDIAPTSLSIFGVQPPIYMDGRAFDVE